MDFEELCKKWGEEVEKHLSENMMPEVQELNGRIKDGYKVKIWLGGPGPTNEEFYPLRKCVKCVLEKRNFTVRFSEDYDLRVDVAKKESIEARLMDLIIILAISPGASTEAMEFAHINDIKNKLTVFIPRQYADGYLYKSLHEKHRVLTGECVFCKNEFKEGGPNLVKNLVTKAELERFNKFMNERNEEFIEMKGG